MSLYTDDPYRVAAPYDAPGEVDPGDYEPGEQEAEADDTIRTVLACRLASSLSSTDGRDVVIEAFSEADADFQRAIAWACSDAEGDDAELGRMVRQRVRAYALGCAKAKGLVTT